MLEPSRQLRLSALAALAALGLVASGCVTTVTDDTTSEAGATAATSSAPTTAATTMAPAETTAPPQAAEPSLQTDAADDPSVTPEAAVSPLATAAATAPPPSIGYITLDGSSWYVDDISVGIREATASTGLELVECDSGGTREGALACAAELADADVLGFISMQPFADLAAEICTAVGEVPAVGILYDQGPCQVSLLDIDQAESGRLAGAALGALAAERWECDVKAFVALGSGVGDAIGAARLEGYRTGFGEHCEMPKAKRSLRDTQHLITAKTGMDEVLDEVAGKPIVVAGVTDLAALGALQSAAESGRSKHVWVAGQLADPAARRALACQPRYVASVAQFPDRFGARVVPLLAEAIDGGTVAPRIEAELGLVTSENVRELFPDTPDCDA